MRNRLYDEHTAAVVIAYTEYYECVSSVLQYVHALHLNHNRQS
jgi:hypothetical protein